MVKLFSGEHYLLGPNPNNSQLYRPVRGMDHKGHESKIDVIEEKPLTIFLNSQEIVTSMTIGDYPEYLAVGFLINQKMLNKDEKVNAVDFDGELNVVVVRTSQETNYEEKLQKKIRTSGCALGTTFGDIMEDLDKVDLPERRLHTSWMYELTAKINRTNSLYLKAGAIHGTVLCHKSEPLVYMEDVGRHNAVDKVCGWMFFENESPDDKILYTTGRLTSEMVIKTALMGIPILISRSGFTAWGVELARKVGLTVIGRLRGQRFVCLSGENRLVFDEKLADIES
ncbi:MAG: formate dehydrogenase accessory sulfurtransferase FdhD [Pseudomonadota bacterium]|nr:formate dehydrogenase accessory sulfurtransferase FdhD [Pseudomonadota bacterium]